MNHQNNLRLRRYLVIFSLVAILAGLSPQPSEAADTTTGTHKSDVSVAAGRTPLKLFQKSISKADGDRCPMYPSCSHYSSQAFERHNAIVAWILTADRLLRCGRDETRRSKRVYIGGRVKAKDSLNDNTFWWSTP